MGDPTPFKQTFVNVVGITVGVGVPLICIALGAAFLPKGTQRTGKLVAKDGSWVIEYKVGDSVRTTPLFTSEELDEITLWVTEEDPSPTGKRSSTVWLGLLIVGVIVLVAEIIALTVFLVLRAKKKQRANIYNAPPAPAAPPLNASYYTY